VEEEHGINLNTDKYNWEEHRDHFILEDTDGTFHAITTPLAPDPDNRLKMVISPGSSLPGSKPAVTLYSVLKSTAPGSRISASLVMLCLKTGRTHQIRVQFASRGLPLLGDIRYGSKAPGCTAALWSYHLGFRHPVTGKPVDVTCPPPQVYPWDLFGGVK